MVTTGEIHTSPYLTLFCGPGCRGQYRWHFVLPASCNGKYFITTQFKAFAVHRSNILYGFNHQQQTNKLKGKQQSDLTQPDSRLYSVPVDSIINIRIGELVAKPSNLFEVSAYHKRHHESVTSEKK